LVTIDNLRIHSFSGGEHI